MTKTYWVVEAVFEDGTFNRTELGSPPTAHGPFVYLSDAQRLQQELARKNVDICWHAAFVVTAV